MSDSVRPHRQQSTRLPVPGILQARTLEWVAISFSNACKGKVKVKLLSRVRPFATPWTAAYQAPLSMGLSRQEYWSGVPLPSPVLLPRKSHGQRSLVGCSPWGREESDTTERLHFHFSLSCLENPRDGGGAGGCLVGCHLWGRTESDTTEAT